MNIKPYRNNAPIKSEEQIREERSSDFKNIDLNVESDTLITLVREISKPVYAEEYGNWLLNIKYKSFERNYAYADRVDAYHDYKLMMKLMLDKGRLV